MTPGIANAALVTGGRTSRRADPRLLDTQQRGRVLPRWAKVWFIVIQTGIAGSAALWLRLPRTEMTVFRRRLHGGTSRTPALVVIRHHLTPPGQAGRRGRDEALAVHPDA